MYELRKTLRKSRQYLLSGNQPGATTKAALCLTVLLGVTWLVGVPMMDDATLAFQYIFAILNTLQGFAIFLFQIASKKDVQKLWANTVHLRSLKFRGASSPPTSPGGTLLSTLKSTLPKKKASQNDKQITEMTTTFTSGIGNRLFSSKWSSTTPTDISPEIELVYQSACNEGELLY